MASLTSVAPAEYEKSLLRASRGAAMVEVVLRVSLFIGSLTAVVVMLTSKQTELVPVPFPPFGRLPSTATFADSPAFVLVALHA